MSHVLRTRFDDQSPWSDPVEFATKRDRDRAAAECRILGGLRTHSYFETESEKEYRLRRLAEREATQ